MGSSRLEMLDAGLFMSLASQLDSGRNYAAGEEIYHSVDQRTVSAYGNPGDRTYT
jgi:hypothetical protein